MSSLSQNQRLPAASGYLGFDFMKYLWMGHDSQISPISARWDAFDPGCSGGWPLCEAGTASSLEQTQPSIIYSYRPVYHVMM